MLRSRRIVLGVVSCLSMITSSLWPVLGVQGRSIHSRVGHSFHEDRSGCFFPRSVRVWRHRTHRVETVPLEDYVARVVASEMGQQFHPRALQMQALAARTYIVHRILNHCTSAKPASAFDVPDSVQQEYKDLSSLQSRSRSGKNVDSLLRVSSEAAESTRGMILVYHGKPIEALFSSSNNGFTQASSAYFGGAPRPYLISKRSEYEKPSVVRKDYTWASFLSLLFPGHKVVNSIAPENVVDFCHRLVRNESGYVQTARIQSYVLSGRQVRERLGLRSSDFTCRVLPPNYGVRFIVRGYGHGVGMSQYGADFMARAGKTLSEMVQQYYPGSSISKFY